MKFKLIGTGIAALSLLATSFSAQAADIPRPVYKGAPSVVAYYNWTGFYAGIVGAYGQGSGSLDAPAISFNPTGWMLGGTLGYNFQVGSIVWGLEGDYSWSDVKGSTACGGTNCTLENKWLSTFRGRVGYAIDRFLPYITAGGAYGNVAVTSALGNSTSSDQLGWTAGVGVEYAFAGNWSAKFEYLYVDLGKFDCSANCGGPTPNNVSFKENVFRLGLNYKFSGPVFSRF